MSENVPPYKNAETLATEGFEVHAPARADTSFTAKMYPPVPGFVPPDVPPEIRVEALSFGAYYLAVLRQEGQPDDILDGPDGKPQRFDSASHAIRAGKARLVPEAKALASASKTFGRDRRRELDEERERVFARFGDGR
ncbi:MULTISPECIES: hypothetical protein [unclassified Mesorhizobium]|uniref:hypothetical protein n=1 Tax=unclassified Mesorhizobium TaxID=325217 RepID=UPI000FCBEE45|nr:MULTISPECIES: hypothetical protein [unclassified Mesorhizobium]RUV23457.1 hypothetical protein EOA91_13505 [Mesorhizobium sp. M1A.F.Ca.IN.022.04.1.1]RWG29754.1 MAG: hypothetical protein EOQ60_20470 [Mesorhizobium sp.]